MTYTDQDYQELFDQDRDAAIERLDNQENAMNLEELLTEYRDMKVELAYSLERLMTLEKQIKTIVKETGEVAEVEGARIKVTNPKKPRVRWDTKALEGVVVMHPELAALRSEYMPAPSVRIVVD